MNLQDMMKQAKVMQDKMQEMQEKLKDIEVTGQSGGGLVTVVMTCKGDVRSLDISPEVIDPADKETLEDLIKAALNTARVNADTRFEEETQTIMQELGLPPNMNLPGAI